MTACRDYDALVSLRAADALEAAETERLEAHLSGCGGCRDALAAYAGALALARLPAPSDAERARTAGLASAVLSEHGRRARRRKVGGRLLVALSAAAAVLAVAVGPGLLRSGSGPDEEATVIAEAGWQEPDLDEIWETTDVLDWSE